METLTLTLFHAIQGKTTEAARVGSSMRALRDNFAFYGYERCIALVAEQLAMTAQDVRFVWIGCNAGEDAL